MGICVYCGKPAGFLQKAHPECEAKHKEGLNQIAELVAASLAGSVPISELPERLEEIAKESFVSQSQLREVLITEWEKSVERFLEDNQLSESEEALLMEFASRLSLSQAELDKRGAYTRLVKAAVIRDLMNGIIPDRIRVEGKLPFKFQKNEKMIWVFPRVKYYEDRKKRRYVGGHHGMSFRIAKGVYYRIGAFKGHPVEVKERVFVGEGILCITTKHLYFGCEAKNFRIRHDKIVAIVPYSDGVLIQRDAQTAVPQIFVTGDGWFVYNLLMNIPTI
mgnify:FL=1